jgi:cell division septation protein DedD
MASTVSARLGTALCAILALAGCEGAQMPGFLQPRAAASELAASAPGSVVEQDEEAPDVFRAAERGIWDGRPSLGGVWVAHPDVTEPQRVVIRNTANGKSTIGALFRRDGEAPGPRLLISSDAAATLEILAGQPTDLDVVALVRREIEVAPPPVADTPAEDAADTETASADAEAADGAGGDDAAAIAAAALAATGAAAGATADTASEAAGAATDTASETAAEAPAPRRGLFGFLRRGGGAAAGAATADAAAEAPSDTAGGDTPLAPAAVETQALDAPPAAADADATAAVPADAAPAGGTERSFVQVAIFSVEENATEAADRLRAAGIVPDIRQSQSGERTIWRVLAGPASGRADLDALLNSVKALGFADAYFVRG